MLKPTSDVFECAYCGDGFYISTTKCNELYGKYVKCPTCGAGVCVGISNLTTYENWQEDNPTGELAMYPNLELED